MEKYLVINGGSSSLKFSLYDLFEKKEIISGVVERIGQEVGNIVIKEKNRIEEKVIVSNHTDAVKIMLKKLLELNYINSLDEIKGIGHRVLLGGKYADSVLIDDNILEYIKTLIEFGELHLPGEIYAIESMMEVLPNVPNVGVFDTSFHQTIPIYNKIYAIPYKYYSDYGIEKKGFHGSSHKYVYEQTKKLLNKNQDEEINVITCHIGNGSSLSLIKDGKCVDTTMGLTPLDGVVMGTRSGTIDPSIIKFICKKENINVDECLNILNKESGLLGISGVSSDFRDLEAARDNGNKRAKLAIEMLEKSIMGYIGKFLAEANYNVDAIVFTAGIGENIPNLRKNILENFKGLGININDDVNNAMRFGKQGKISTNDSFCNVFVIPTNEELAIVNETERIINDNKEKEEKNNYVKKLIKGI